MIMDLLNAEFMCENPPLRPKDKEIFFKKFSILEDEEIKDAFKVSVKRLLDIVSEIVPCVGCRRRLLLSSDPTSIARTDDEGLFRVTSRIIDASLHFSVERLFYQMKAGPGRYALYPLVVTPEGALILKTDVHNYPFTVGAMFQNHQLVFVVISN